MQPEITNRWQVRKITVAFIFSILGVVVFILGLFSLLFFGTNAIDIRTVTGLDLLAIRLGSLIVMTCGAAQATICFRLSLHLYDEEQGEVMSTPKKALMLLFVACVCIILNPPLWHVAIAVHAHISGELDISTFPGDIINQLRDAALLIMGWLALFTMLSMYTKSGMKQPNEDSIDDDSDIPG